MPSLVSNNLATSPAPVPFRGPAAWPWFALFYRDQVACLRKAAALRQPLLAVGKIVPFQSSERIFALATTPQLTEEILTDQSRFQNAGQTTVRGPRQSSQSLLRTGLPQMNGVTYDIHHKLVLPAFQKRAVDAYIPRMIPVIDRSLQNWPVESSADLWLLARTLALGVTNAVLFDADDHEAANRLGALINDWLICNFSIQARILPYHFPGSSYSKLLKTAEKVDRQIRALIAKSKQLGSNTPDLLSILIRSYAQDGMSEKELLGQVTILFAASYENVANTLTWTLFLLAQHPDIARKAVTEVREVLGDSLPKPELLSKLPFLNNVVRESMRILPSVPYLLRRVVTPTTLAGLPLTKGDRIITSPYILHHNENLFPEPERFRPERWESINPSPFEYMPFGAGPRTCIGYFLAMSEIKLMLAMVLQRFRLTIQPHTRIDRVVRVTMGPKRGMPVTLHKQDLQYQRVPVRGNILEMVSL